MKKIKKLELPYDDGEGHFSSGASVIHITRKVNEIIDVLNQKQPELVCMKCGSKENLNSNKDGSFVECDDCMWKKEPEKQERWRDGDIFNALDKEGFLKENFSDVFVLCNFDRYSKLESFARKHNAPKELLVVGKNIKKSKLLKEKENE